MVRAAARAAVGVLCAAALGGHGRRDAIDRGQRRPARWRDRAAWQLASDSWPHEGRGVNLGRLGEVIPCSRLPGGRHETKDEGNRANPVPFYSHFINDDHNRGGNGTASTSGGNGSHGRGTRTDDGDIHDTDIREPVRYPASQ